MKKLIHVIFVLVVISIHLGGCASEETAPPPPAPTLIAGHYTYDDLVRTFDYDPQESLDIQEVSVSDEEAGVEVHDISYAGTLDYRVPAYLVVPPGEGPFAGVLFMHQGFGSRNSFLNEAISLAEKGVVSLLVHHGSWKAVPDNYKQIVVSLRRGADLLELREDIDSSRLAYVGHSWGATFGGILADVDKRFQTYILIAGVPSFSEIWERKDLVPFDGIHYIGQAAPAPLLFQLANQDEYVSRDTALLFYEAASEPKQVNWYDTTHFFKHEEAQQDRLEWLSRELKLP
ncbi:MAG: alpha/beta hydrolase [Anaerolineaceae bacterium]|nr:MAG: alpha/beta hydrolase [Anaerolineaceae bacterium]